MNSLSIALALVTTGLADRTDVRFGADVLPILARYGCNAGSCHGKKSGQGGFRLSLLGSDPESDWACLTREGQGRRVDRIDPGRSLLVRKATGQAAHGGGVRFNRDSPEAKTLVRWIAEGMAYDEDEPALTRLDVEPARWVAERGGSRPLKVLASFGDGKTKDVTRLASFGTNDGDLAEVNEWGMTRQVGEGVGEAVILASYGGMVGVSRGVVAGGKTKPISDGSNGLVDRYVNAKLDELGIEPSVACTDAEFARRSALDLCGILPRPEDVAAFQNEANPGKRSRWVEGLIGRPEFADQFAMKWSALLRNKRTLGTVSMPGTFAFHDWIREAFAEGWPFDRFASEILTAQGDAASNPAVVWYRNAATAEERADDAAQVFLGVRIGCARCHHHPSERWTQDDYHGFASIFARVGTKPGLDPITPGIFTAPTGLTTHPANGKTCRPKPLGDHDFGDLGPRDDPRVRLAEWLRRPDNPYFARAIVNRTWKHFMGRGLVEPEDDFRASNPPTHPELLDALAADFLANRSDFKHLVRTIATSETYGRSSEPTSSNRSDRRYYARFLARRLPAEALLDAIDNVAGTATAFPGMPVPTRAVQLPDDGFASPLLDLFGRPKRLVASECERETSANLAQAMHLIHSAELQAKLASPTGRAATMARDDSGTDAAKVEELYRIALSRPADTEEMAACLEWIGRRRRKGRAASGFEDVIWALLNTKEFLFIY